MDRLILGDNQFFGVNHMSEERGMAQLVRFQDNAAILQVLDTAYDLGIQAFSFSTHERVRALCDHFRSDPQRYSQLRLYPALPYAHKYAHAVAEKGVLGAIKDVLFAGNQVSSAFGMLVRGGTAVLTRDPVELMTLVVDTELQMFRGLRVEVVFLQNIVTDLLLGLGWREILTAFAQHIRERHGARPGFITLNLPRLIDTLEQCEVTDAVVCAAVNKVGFQMNPDVAAYERALAVTTYPVTAMSVLAAGAVPACEAVEYVTRFPAIRSVMFGASSSAHMREFQRLIEKGGVRDARPVAQSS